MKTKLVTGRKTDYQTASSSCILSDYICSLLEIVELCSILYDDEFTDDSDNDDESSGAV